jgi:hypothetical protein
MGDEREEGGGRPTAEQERKAEEFDPRAQQTGQTRDGDGAIVPQLGGQQPQPGTPGQTSPASPLAPAAPGQQPPGIVYGEAIGSRNFVTTDDTPPSVESGKTTSVETPTVARQKSD